MDSSSIVLLYNPAPASRLIRRAFGMAEETASSLMAYAEVRAAMASARRARLIQTEPAFVRRKQDFEDDWAKYIHLPVTSGLVERAGFLAEQHALSGFDAIHLATAVALRASSPDEVQISTWDKRLASAALSEGFVLAHEVTI